MLERLDLRAAASRVRSQWCELARTVSLGLCRRALAERAGEEGRREERRRGASSAEMGGERRAQGRFVRGEVAMVRWPRARTRAIANYRRAKNYPTITGGNIFPAKNPVIGGLPGNPG